MTLAAHVRCDIAAMQRHVRMSVGEVVAGTTATVKVTNPEDLYVQVGAG